MIKNIKNLLKKMENKKIIKRQILVAYPIFTPKKTLELKILTKFPK